MKHQIFFSWWWWWLVFNLKIIMKKSLTQHVFLFLCISARCVKRWKIRKMSIKLVMQFCIWDCVVYVGATWSLNKKYLYMCLLNLSLSSLIISFISNTNLHDMERNNNICFFSYQPKCEQDHVIIPRLNITLMVEPNCETKFMTKIVQNSIFPPLLGRKIMNHFQEITLIKVFPTIARNHSNCS
jgi:hypothetical protein